MCAFMIHVCIILMEKDCSFQSECFFCEIQFLTRVRERLKKRIRRSWTDYKASQVVQFCCNIKLNMNLT